jgi:hypothetical protein
MSISPTPTQPPPDLPAATSGSPAVLPPEQLPRRGHAFKTWQFVTGTFVALLLGLALGAAGQAPTDEPTAAEAGADVTELEATVDQLRDELGANANEIAALEAEIASLEEELDSANEQLAAAPAPETDDGEQASAEQTVGNYEFTDIQVSRDFVGDFQVRTRVRNTGPSRESVSITASLFSEGSVVGTATGFHDLWDSDQTVTMELISIDTYTEWDQIEFQIDSEY